MDEEIKEFLKTRTKEELIKIIDKALELDSWFKTGVEEMVIKERTNSKLRLYDESTKAYDAYCDKLKEIVDFQNKIKEKLGKKVITYADMTEDEFDHYANLHSELAVLKKKSDDIEKKIGRME